MFRRDRSLDWHLESDLDKTSEDEVTFVAVGPQRTQTGHHRPRCTTSSKGRRFSRSMTANGLSDG